jgi:hypothetical protein
VDATLTSFRWRRSLFTGSGRAIFPPAATRRRIFFISYSGLMMVWPFYETRFWLPVLPFLVAYTGLSMRYLVRKGISAHLFEAWVLGFLIMGLRTLAFGTVVTFSGASIGDCAAGYCQRGFDSNQAVDPDALRVLQAFR